MGLRTPDLVLGLMYDVIYVNIIVYHITSKEHGWVVLQRASPLKLGGPALSGSTALISRCEGQKEVL